MYPGEPATTHGTRATASRPTNVWT